MTGLRKPPLVIIPALDEEQSLPGVLAALRDAHPELEVLVVNDGSRDRTAEIARAHGATVLSHPASRGYGAALVTGYRHALARGHDVIVQLDADGQHDPRQIGRLLAALATGEHDVVIGSRMIDGGVHDTSIPRLVGIRLFAWLGRTLMQRSVTDPTSGFQAMNRRGLEFLAENTPADFPDLNVLVALHRAGIRTVEVPVTMRARLHGRSQMRGLRPLIYVPKMLLYLAGVYRAKPGRR